MIFLLLLSVFLRGASSSFSPGQPYSFTFSSFDPKSCSDDSRLICMGAVTANDGYLSLTSEPSNNSSELPFSKVGRVLYKYPVTVWPAMISTTFTVRIIPYANTISSDGLTFVFAEDTSPSSGDFSAEYLGLYTSGKTFSPLAVELDTFKNEFDPDDNHIGINVGSIISTPAESLNSSGIDLKSGNSIYVQIYYDGCAKVLRVFVAYEGYLLEKLIEKEFHLDDIVPSSVYVGFTAATGIDGAESHQLLDWTFTTFPLPPSSVNKQNLAMPI